MKGSTTKDLLSHLCDQMKKLSVKAINPDEAKVQSDLVKQANNIYKYELDKAKAIMKYEGIDIKDISSDVL